MYSKIFIVSGYIVVIYNVNIFYVKIFIKENFYVSYLIYKDVISKLN